MSTRLRERGQIERVDQKTLTRRRENDEKDPAFTVGKVGPGKSTQRVDHDESPKGDVRSNQLLMNGPRQIPKKGRALPSSSRNRECLKFPKEGMSQAPQRGNAKLPKEGIPQVPERGNALSSPKRECQAPQRGNATSSPKRECLKLPKEGMLSSPKRECHKLPKEVVETCKS
ncbi:small proline-rich protein 3 isoform 2 [Corchorus olitorius]|uniref:Small proline-rich protein 3 isoform 2 n=1 Tax=Corchorus olitorius TaxID=93759 RepID=A0A1R3HWN1_9ROSI|nr:small proline-rich protein 3 isoform 2 [Corchorus olitorius]